MDNELFGVEKARSCVHVRMSMREGKLLLPRKLQYANVMAGITANIGKSD